MMFVIISLVLELQRLNLKFSKSKRKKPIQFSFFGVLRLSEVFRLIWRILKFSKSDCRFGTVGSQRAKICVVQNFSWLLFCLRFCFCAGCGYVDVLCFLQKLCFGQKLAGNIEGNICEKGQCSHYLFLCLVTPVNYLLASHHGSKFFLSKPLLCSLSKLAHS